MMENLPSTCSLLKLTLAMIIHEQQNKRIFSNYNTSLFEAYLFTRKLHLHVCALIVVFLSIARKACL